MEYGWYARLAAGKARLFLPMACDREADMGKHEPASACATCGGSGKVIVMLDGKQQEITCTACRGTGKA